MLFVAFCEDRGLIPRNLLDRMYTFTNPFDSVAVYHNFIGLFRAVD